MDIRSVAPAQLPDASLADIVDFLRAVQCCDAPHQPPVTAVSYRRMVLHGWDGQGPEQLWQAYEGDDLVALASMWLSHWDNLHLAFVDVSVRPDRRRRGIGSALFEQLADAAKAAGRTTLLAEAWKGSGGGAFLERQGFAQAQVSVQRRLRLLALDHERINQLHEEAAAKADGYELVRLVGAAPQLREELVDLVSAINDAPTDDLDIEDDVFSPERLRGFEEAQTALGQRLYRILARRTSDGAWAGHTVLTVDPSRPTWGLQGDTTVAREHRGHRLGLLLKTEMLRWLGETEPQLEQIDTWNAASNAATIAVNDALGCVVVAEETGWQKRL